MRRVSLILLLVACGSRAPAPSPPAAATPPTTTTIEPTAVDAAVQHNVDEVNRHRAANGVGALVLDATLTAFAQQANADFAAGGEPHAFIRANRAQLVADAGATFVKENQGKRAGRFRGDQQLSATKMISSILESMMAEGPGGGHHDTMVNPDLKRIGVSVIVEGNRVFITNDFAD